MENPLSSCGCMQRFVSSERVKIVFYNNLIESRRENCYSYAITEFNVTAFDRNYLLIDNISKLICCNCVNDRVFINISNRHLENSFLQLITELRIFVCL